jgi:ubiquinone biosynthesis protein
MKALTRTYRLLRINFILMRYNIGEIVLGKHWFYPFRVLVYLNPYYWTIGRKLPRGERIRMALEDLGPIFVKAGQIISTRRDLLPDDIANELTKLQDRVQPFSGKLAKEMIEKSLGCPLSHIFKQVDNEALASASIAQVHAATLLNGDDVVIKVLRPNIGQIIERDIDLLLSLAKTAEKYWRNVRHLKAKEIIDEIAQTLNDELDLMREAANASQLKRNFAGSDELHVPKIYWDFTRQNVLVMERIYGIPIHDIERLKQAGINMEKLSQRVIEVFFTQIFRDSYFHADPHPGNIFVSEKDLDDPKIIAVDFGIVGSLNHDDQRYIAENMIAFFKRDYQRVAELHIASGWLPPDTRIDLFEGAIRAVSEPIFEQPLRDISFGKLLLRLFQVARGFHINIQPQLILLQKTLLNIEGLSRQLAPGFNLWEAASPQIEKWLKKQVGVVSLFKRIRNNLPIWSEQLPEIPGMLYEVLRETKHQQEKLRFDQAESAFKRRKHTTSIVTKIGYFTIGAGFTLLTVLTAVHFNI